jgi:hypothetical protein
MKQRLQKDLSEFSFQILNTTSATQQMFFLSNPSNTQDISNQFTEYSWDITSIANNIGIYDLVSFESRTNPTLPFITYSASILSNSLSGIVTALNSLQIASFYYEVIGGNTYIRTYNDSLEFGQLNIIDTASSSFSFFYSISIPYAFAGDGGTQITSSGTFDTGVLANPQTVPTTNATSLVATGETITVAGVTPSVGTSIICGIRVIADEIVGSTTTNLSDETFYNSGYTATPFTMSNPNATYDLSVLYPDLDANYYVSTTSTNGSISIDYGQGSVPIWLNPTTQLADYTTSVSNGQFVTVGGVAPNSGSVLTVRVNIRQQDISTGVISTISNNLYSSGTPFTIEFPVVTGFAYQIFITDL